MLIFQFRRPGVTLPPLAWAKIIGIGLHLDLAAASCFLVPLAFWCSIWPDWFFKSWFNRFLLLGACFLFWSAQIFLLFVEYYFFDEFKSRYTTVAVDYLLYPTEVAGNIWESYPVGRVLAISLAGGLLMWAWCRETARPMWNEWSTLKSRLLCLVSAVGLALAAVSTVSLREYNFSHDRLVNEFANSGPVSFYAAAVTRDLDYKAFYLTLPPAEAFKRTRALLDEPDTHFLDKNSLRRRVEGDASRPRWNVLLLLEESLGSEFWGSLGRKEATLTPNLDKLATEGLLFANVYADGNRTVRGFEGALSSFPPLPGDSIVKRDHSQNVETIARVLKRDGYQTLFVYGGRGLFDGMRSFALDNGYDRFIEQKDFDHPTFKTIWGVCDEDTYHRTIAEMRAMNATGKPFFTTVLTVSNHKPYTYPKGRVAENPDDLRRENAVKYTDWALGQFFAEAKKEPFWTNTIFVLVADHGARVYGSQTIPIFSYEIPLLILGPAVVKAPRRDSQLACQLDVSPTILGLIGRPYETLFFGRDLLNTPSGNGFALLNHNRDIGMFRHNRMAVLNLNKTAEFFHGDPKTEEMTLSEKPDAADLQLQADTEAIYQTADDLYNRHAYALDKK